MNEVFELESIVGEGVFSELGLSDLKPSPFNSFKVEDIDEMKSSIQSAGLLTPLSVTGPDAEGKYEILSGERRYTALLELEAEGQRKGSVPCYIIGDADMSDTEKKLLIVVANITSRGHGDGIHEKRFEVVRLLKELEDSNPDRYGNMCRDAARFLKVSDRYGRMYNQIYRCGGDDLKKLAASGDIRINDASRLSSLSEEEQKAAVAEVRSVKKAQEKTDIVSKYVSASTSGTPRKIPKVLGGGKKSQKLEFDLHALDSGEYDDLLDDEGEGLDVDVDGSGFISRQKRMDERSYTESYQRRLVGIIEWVCRMMEKESPTVEEWDVIDACKRLTEKFR